MEFQHYNLGKISKGDVVEITLSGANAQALLLDDGNFDNYRYKRNYNYFSPDVSRSPMRIPVPHSGTWHVVIASESGNIGMLQSAVKVRFPAGR